MKKLFFALAVMLAVPAFAQVGIEANIRQSLNIGWSKVTKFRHSLDCYPKGKGNQYADLGGESLIFETAKSTLGTSLSWPVVSVHAFELGTTSVHLARLSSDPGIQKYQVSFIDGVQWDSYRHRGDSDCVIREHHWHVQNHHMQGYYAVTYKLPMNGRAIRVRIADVQGQGSHLAKRTIDDYHRQSIEVGSDMILWGDPGSTIKIPVDVNIHSASGVQGSLVIEIEELGATLEGKSALELFAELNDIYKTFVNKGPKDDDVMKLLRVGGAILSSPESSRALVASIGLETYRSLVDWLYNVANGDHPKLKHELHLKAMAAALSYEFALNLLDDMSVFCEGKDVYLPFSDRTVRTKGFIIAHYWMNRDVRRLKALRFPEVRAYLQELVRWENNRYTYEQVVTNPKEFKKLRDGYKKIRQHSELAFDVYGDIRRGLDKTFSIFQTIAGSDEMRGHLNEALEGLSSRRYELNKNFSELALSFRRGNTAKIKASPVLDQLNELERSTTELSEELLSRIKLVDLNSDPSSGFLGTMTSLLGHQVAIFDEKLKSEFAEPIRFSYQNIERTNSAKQMYSQCLEVQ